MDMSGTFALVLRVFVFYPLAGFIAAYPSVKWDEATGILTVDVNGLSVALGAGLYAVLAGGTFAWSRFIKSDGGVT